MSVAYDRFASDLSRDLGEDQVDRAKLLSSLKSYLERNRLTADWTVIERASSEFLINALSVMSPYGPEEKQALLEAHDLKARAHVLVALAEMELAQQGGSGGMLQ
jgi:Lon protease-like protein